MMTKLQALITNNCKKKYQEIKLWKILFDEKHEKAQFHKNKIVKQIQEYSNYLQKHI